MIVDRPRPWKIETTDVESIIPTVVAKPGRPKNRRRCTRGETP
jgi:hypothetical protein